MSIFSFSGTRAWSHQLEKMEEERIEMKGMVRCPVFSGDEVEYKNWMMTEGKKREYPALEMRSTMRFKALDVVVCLEQEKLMERTGIEILLRELEKHYQNESRVYKFYKGILQYQNGT